MTIYEKLSQTRLRRQDEGAAAFGPKALALLAPPRSVSLREEASLPRKSEGLEVEATLMGSEVT